MSTQELDQARAEAAAAVEALKECQEFFRKCYYYGLEFQRLFGACSHVLDGTAAKALLDELATLRAARDAAQRVRQVARLSEQATAPKLYLVREDEMQSLRATLDAARKKI